MVIDLVAEKREEGDKEERRVMPGEGVAAGRGAEGWGGPGSCCQSMEHSARKTAGRDPAGRGHSAGSSGPLLTGPWNERFGKKDLRHPERTWHPGPDSSCSTDP